MQKHALSFAERYETLFAPLPVSSSEVLYFDRKPVKLPYAEDFPRLHYHDRYEVGVCESGEGLFLSEGAFYSVSTGDFIFIAPERCHYSRSLNRAENCICRFSYINADAVAGLISLASRENEKEEKKSKGVENIIPAVIRASEHPKACDLLSRIMDACKAQAPNHAALAALALSIFLLEAENLFETAQQMTPASRKSDDAVAKTSEYLALHYNRSDTARELAARCHLSESQLRRRFIAIYGVPPIAYRNHLRCKIAAELLIRSVMPVSEIAERIGYTATSDLYKAFKKMYGVSPAAYRAGNSL